MSGRVREGDTIRVLDWSPDVPGHGKKWQTAEVVRVDANELTLRIEGVLGVTTVDVSEANVRPHASSEASPFPGSSTPRGKR